MTIKEYLNQNKTTLTELSKKTGICISALSKIKDGRVKVTDSVKKKFKDTLNIDLETSPTREQQLEEKLKEVLKDFYKLTGKIQSLKELLMEKDIIINFLAHQLRCLHKYSSPRTNKEELYKNYRALLDKYNKLCYNINTEEYTNENN